MKPLLNDKEKVFERNFLVQFDTITQISASSVQQVSDAEGQRGQSKQDNDCIATNISNGKCKNVCSNCFLLCRDCKLIKYGRSKATTITNV